MPLAAEYGALPVVGIGHSCGALLQLLVTCLFPDTPRAANALISFNNKPVSDAVPGFEELVLPLVTQVMGDKKEAFSNRGDMASKQSVIKQSRKKDKLKRKIEMKKMGKILKVVIRAIFRIEIESIGCAVLSPLLIHRK